MSGRTRIASTARVLRDAPCGLHPMGAPQDDDFLGVGPKVSVILGRPQSGRLEGRTARVLGVFSVAFRVMLLFVLVLALSGCGKKGAPQPPPDEPNTYPRTYPSA